MGPGPHRPPSVGGEFGRELAESPLAKQIYDGLRGLGFDLTVTSVDRGGHVAGSDHYKHRALDVGAVNGTTIGWNAPTWDLLTRAIGSGLVKKIGTFKAFADQPTLQEWAKTHGVTLFEDEGTGPHVHLAL